MNRSVCRIESKVVDTWHSRLTFGKTHFSRPQPRSRRVEKATCGGCWGLSKWNIKAIYEKYKLQASRWLDTQWMFFRNDFFCRIIVRRDGFARHSLGASIRLLPRTTFSLTKVLHSAVQIIERVVDLHEDIMETFVSRLCNWKKADRVSPLDRKGFFPWNFCLKTWLRGRRGRLAKRLLHLFWLFTRNENTKIY